MTGAPWPGLSYTALEGLIATLERTSPEAVRIRFRKLRLRPFPDDIRAGPGGRVKYDLPRVVAVLAVFELNRLFVPQGHAAAMVEAVWPELCRAVIAAACRAKLAIRPAAMPSSASAVLLLVPDAFASRPEDTLVGSLSPGRDIGPPRSGMRIDVAPMVAAIAAAAGEGADLASAFSLLEASFGWTRPAFPTRSEVAAMARGRGFLEEGPYLRRAEMLLTAPLTSFDVATELASVERMQAAFDYLDEPVPVDAWKAEAGTETDEPRLKHLIHAFALARGLVPRKTYPATLLLAAEEDPAGRALALIAKLRALCTS